MRYILNYSHPHQPFEGHSYLDPCGQLITASTLKGLVQALKEFREKNGMEVSEPEQDIALYYLPRWPDMVSEAKEPNKIPPEPQDAHLLACWRWIMAIYRDPPKRLLEIEAMTLRAEACLKCPYNAPLDLSGDREITRRKYLICRGDTPAGCGWCKHHAWHAGVACMLPDTIKLACPEPPAGCWVKTGTLPPPPPAPPGSSE